MWHRWMLSFLENWLAACLALMSSPNQRIIRWNCSSWGRTYMQKYHVSRLTKTQKQTHHTKQNRQNGWMNEWTLFKQTDRLTGRQTQRWLQTDTHRQIQKDKKDTETVTDRQTNCLANRLVDWQAGKYRQRQPQTSSQRGRHTGRQVKDRQTNKWTDKRADRQIDRGRQSVRLTDREADRQKDSQRL